MFDKEKFKERFDAYYPMLCRVAFGYIPDSQECEDIVQESFINVWNNGRYELDDKDFVSYMVRAVKNNCITFLRKQNLDIVSLDDNTICLNSAGIMDEESEPINHNEVIAKVLKELPPKCKEIFLLSKMHGLKYNEIAIKMDISIKTVENQMGKALKIIRTQIKAGVLTFLLIFLFMFLK